MRGAPTSSPTSLSARRRSGLGQESGFLQIADAVEGANNVRRAPTPCRHCGLKPRVSPPRVELANFLQTLRLGVQHQRPVVATAWRESAAGYPYRGYPVQRDPVRSVPSLWIGSSQAHGQRSQLEDPMWPQPVSRRVWCWLWPLANSRYTIRTGATSRSVSDRGGVLSRRPMPSRIHFGQPNRRGRAAPAFLIMSRPRSSQTVIVEKWPRLYASDVRVLDPAVVKRGTLDLTLTLDGVAVPAEIRFVVTSQELLRCSFVPNVRGVWAFY